MPASQWHNELADRPSYRVCMGLQSIRVNTGSLIGRETNGIRVRGMLSSCHLDGFIVWLGKVITQKACDFFFRAHRGRNWTRLDCSIPASMITSPLRQCSLPAKAAVGDYFIKLGCCPAAIVAVIASHFPRRCSWRSDDVSSRLCFRSTSAGIAIILVL